MKLLLIIGGTVAALGLFLLATASGDTGLPEHHYPLLLGLNAALAALLAKHIEEEAQVETCIAEQPRHCVASGLQKLLLQ